MRKLRAHLEAKEHFIECAELYESLTRMTIPHHDVFFDIMLGFVLERRIDVPGPGGGTGLVTRMVLFRTQIRRSPAST